MNSLLATLFQRLREAGFSAPQAAAYWKEVHALASPVLFSFASLRADPQLRAAAAAHPLLAQAVLSIQTPSQWQDYCEQMPLHLRRVQQQVCQRRPECEHALRDYWPVLGLDEGIEDFARRTTMGHAWESQVQVGDWPGLLARVQRRQALDVLCAQVQLPSHPVRRSWQRVLAMTGLRSLRWSYGDEPGDPRHQAVLMEALLYAQELLRGGVSWRGPVLGLAGSTSLALTDRQASDGMVQPDPGGRGQTMTLGHWSVLAHEWMHALDIRLARHFKCRQTWATHAALRWDEPHDPPEMLMAWFWQMGHILGAAPCAERLPAIRAEVVDWEGRLLASLGNAMPVQEEVARQKAKLARDEWTHADAREGWMRILEDGDAAHQHRTAHLLASDVAFASSVALGQSQGYWAEYIAALRAEVSAPPPDGSALPPQQENAPARARAWASLRYLTNAVEVMARSFESSLPGEHPDAVWLPPSHRPNAGLLWPTQSEALEQGKAWRQTLRQLRPLWETWKQAHNRPRPAAGGGKGVAS